MKTRLCSVVLAILNCGIAGAGEGTNAPPEEPRPVTPALPLPDPMDLKPIPDPEPLVFMDGRKIATMEEWETRKKEITDLLQHYIYGFSGPETPPAGTPPPEVVKTITNAYGGLATMYEIAVRVSPATNDLKNVMWLSLAVPNKGPGPFPTVLHFGRPRGALAEKTSQTEVDQGSVYMIERGYAVAGFSPGGSAGWIPFPVHSGPWVDRSDPRFKAYPFGQHAIPELELRPMHGRGERALWAWQMRRMMDALLLQKEVDGKRVIFVGGSRGGMSVILAAALDKRAAMVYAWQPAGMRVRSYNWPDRPGWFAPSLQTFCGRLDCLPVDTYCAAAALAPKPLLFTTTYRDYTEPGEAIYEKIASAYRFMGADVKYGERPASGSAVFTKGPLGVHVRETGHVWTVDDIRTMLDFADEHLKPAAGRKDRQ